MQIDEAIRTFLREEEPFTAKTIAKIIDLPHDKVARKLNELVDENEAVKIPNIAGDMRQPLFTVKELNENE
jgi:Fic family protein